MKKLKKVLKIFFLTTASVLAVTLLSCMGYYFSVTHGVSLQKDKLENLEASSLTIFDKSGLKIVPSSEAFISASNLNEFTKDAFVAAEDKRFYSHHGVDYLRVGSAMMTNLKKHSFSEGASTISQQLIKNTHLSNEKTIKRKLKEFKLTKKLEKNYSKDEILEMYLNNIYFGGGCYGIENAAIHYFGKSATELSIAESALLAGTINAPAVYDIQNKTENAVKRRNLILKLMKAQGKISSEEYELAISEPVNLNLTKLSNNNFIYNEIVEEACRHLKKSENELKSNDIKIYTYFDSNLNAEILEKIQNSYGKVESNYACSIVIDNKTHGISACVGGSATLLKHQPGSTIKPIAVYAPAIENGIVSPATKLLDEKINIGGYSPENADKKYHGYVSVREALTSSLNIPAVKLLNEVGTRNAEEFAEKLGLEFSDGDGNLALALGGLTDGISLKALAEAYSAFACDGSFKNAQYIYKITQGNKILYQDNEEAKQVMKDSTAYLITDILKGTSVHGTAKRLKDLGFSVASKTGTVGSSTSSKNTDAFNVCYTPSHTVLSYFGGGLMTSSVNGSTYPTMLSKDVLLMLYNESKPEEFSMPSSVVKLYISKEDYDKNIVSLSSTDDGILEVFSKTNIPKQKKLSLNSKIEVFNFENKKPIISFFMQNGYSYKIVRRKNMTEEVISSAMAENNKIIKFEDKTAKSSEIYEYFVEFCEISSGKIIKSNSVKLKSF